MAESASDLTTATEREAIAAMEAAWEDWYGQAWDDPPGLFGHILAALSGDVHARLATEKGALIQTGWARGKYLAPPGAWQLNPPSDAPDWEPVYRLVDPPRPEDDT
jgi:hypothetical protein